MRTNEIRMYLHNFGNLKRHIRELRQDIHDYTNMHDEIDGIKAQELSDMPKARSENNSIVERMCISNINTGNKINDLHERLDKLTTLRRAITETVYYLGGTDRAVIYKRYFEKEKDCRGCNWQEVAEYCNITEKVAKNKDVKIIKKIQQRMLI